MHTVTAANILILSDRGVDENHVAIPSLLAVSAMQQHLIQTKKRTAVAMILESPVSRVRSTILQHCLGYGACAINPYLAQDTIEQLVDDHLLDKDYYAAINDYNSCSITWNCKNCFQDGYFHNPVLSGIQDL